MGELRHSHARTCLLRVLRFQGIEPFFGLSRIETGLDTLRNCQRRAGQQQRKCDGNEPD